MLRTAFWFMWLAFYLLSRLPLYWRGRWLRSKGRIEDCRALTQRQVDLWIERMFRHIKVSVEVTGAENLPQNGETVLFCSNHQSYMDIPVLLHYLDKPHAIMAKKELSRIPLLRGWMDLLGCMYVDRDDVRASLEALHKGEAVLQSGQSLILCPEGTRAKSDTLGEFKGGGFRMAYKTGVPVVPVAIDGTWRILEGNAYKLQKCNVRLVILPPIPTAGMTRTELKALPKQVEDLVRAAKDDRTPDYTPQYRPGLS